MDYMRTGIRLFNLRDKSFGTTAIATTTITHGYALVFAHFDKCPN
jgi:hypothetical protein